MQKDTEWDTPLGYKQVTTYRKIYVILLLLTLVLGFEASDLCNNKGIILNLAITNMSRR